jgi:hypothetical protein
LLALFSSSSTDGFFFATADPPVDPSILFAPEVGHLHLDIVEVVPPGVGDLLGRLLDLLGEILEGPQVVLPESVQHKDVVEGHVLRIRGPSRRRVRDEKVGRLLGVHVKPDVVAFEGLIPLGVGGPPVRLAAEQNAQRGGALLPVDNPKVRPLGVAGLLLLNRALALPDEQGTGSQPLPT